MLYENATKLGFNIKDDAEIFTKDLLKKGTLNETKPGDTYLGGPFAIAPLESDAMANMDIVDDRKIVD